jgi:8-oxo-dGTP pyrophosphatase MutT (NUDIX family)
MKPRSQSRHTTRTKSRRASSPREPDFVMMLADPEIRLLMRADNVDEAELSRMLKAVSFHLRNSGDKPKSRRGPGYRVPNVDPRKYRRGVGIMLINSRSEILIARRNDVPGEAWEMPQGGIDSGESPRQAAYRELKEEIGTDNARIVAESDNWLYYDLPEELAKKSWHGRWKGQRQKWFVMLFKGDDTEINLATGHPEFDAWRWTTISELESLAVSYKKKLYMSLLREFASVFRD